MQCHHREKPVQLPIKTVCKTCVIINSSQVLPFPLPFHCQSPEKTKVSNKNLDALSVLQQSYTGTKLEVAANSQI